MPEIRDNDSRAAAAWKGDAETFDRMAEEARRTRLPVEESVEIYRQMGLVDWLDGRPADEPVLEIGCCDALHLLNLARGLGRAGFGIDVSRAMLAAGRTEAEAENLPIELAVMDATKLALADETFTTALSFNVLHHFTLSGGLERTLAEAARVLKPGGRLFAAELNLAWPYHVLAFGGAQAIKRIRRVDWVDRTFTDNELALWPGKLVRAARATDLEAVPESVGYFSYVPRLPQPDGERSPWPVRLVRGTCRLASRVGPAWWRHDMFHMTFQKRGPRD